MGTILKFCGLSPVKPQLEIHKRTHPNETDQVDKPALEIVKNKIGVCIVMLMVAIFFQD